MTPQEEIAEIKREHFEAIKSRRVVMVVASDYGYDVEQWTPDGVAPTSTYDTAQEAGARALQLLGLKEPVKPQDWPEVIGIGPNPGPPPKPEPKFI